MTSVTEQPSLVDQGLVLRQRMLAQREQIANRLVEPAASTQGTYPRSVTMRFFIRQPALSLRLLFAIASLLGARRLKLRWFGG